jgi:hypothetical protein
MAKADIIKRKILFLVIRVRFKNKPVKIQNIFDSIQKLDFKNGARYHETSDGINLVAFLDSSKLPIHGIIGDSRKKALPIVETIGQRNGLSLPSSNSGLFEGNHFVIYENKFGTIIIAHEFNFHAPRIGRLAQYIMAKCSSFVDFCSIEPIETQNINTLLKSIKFPKYFEIRAHKSCSFVQLDNSLNSAFRSMADVTDADYFNVSFSCIRGRKNPISMKNFANINSFMQTTDAYELLEKFFIKYKDLTDGEDKEADLTNLFLNEPVNVQQIDPGHRHVDTNFMYKALDDSIKKHNIFLDGIQT